MSKKNYQSEGLTRRPIKKVKNENTNRALEEEDEETDSENSNDETTQKLYPPIPKGDDSSTVESNCQLVENQNTRIKAGGSFHIEYETSKDETSKTSKRESSYGILFVIKTLFTIIFVFFILNNQFAIIPLLRIYFKKYLSSQSSPSSYSPSLNVPDILSTMKKNFIEQDSKIFIILESALNTINSRSEPKSPEILLLVSVGGSESISLEFSRQLAKSISEKPIVMCGTKLSKQDPDIAKMEIDKTLKSEVMKDNLSVIILHNLVQLSFKSAVILHSYCDHENAPFKRAVYIMTASCQHQKDTAKWDKIANQCLKEAWENADEDEVAALLSRITVRVMAIQPPSETKNVKDIN